MSRLVDVLTYMIPDAIFSFENHLESISNPLYTYLNSGQVWYVKSPNGYPWDVNLFDDQYVYQKITENVWGEPTTFKSFMSSNWPGGGLAWCPRFFDPLVRQNPIVTLDSTYRIYSDCSTFESMNLGLVQTHLMGPVVMSFGGDLPSALETISISYQWGNGQNLEMFHYARGYGWVEWIKYNLVNGIYVQVQTSLFNKIVKGGALQVKFPCTIPM